MSQKYSKLNKIDDFLLFSSHGYKVGNKIVFIGANIKSNAQNILEKYESFFSLEIFLSPT